MPTEAARGALYRRITVKLQLISKNAIQQPSQLIIIIMQQVVCPPIGKVDRYSTIS